MLNWHYILRSVISIHFIIIRFDIIEIIAIINLTLNLIEILITITNEEIIFQQLPITVNL